MYGNWTIYEKETWDRGEKAIESEKQWRLEQEVLAEQWRKNQEEKMDKWREEQEREAERRWKRLEDFEKSRIYEREWEYNRRFVYKEKKRHYKDHHAGLPCVDQPPPVSWTSLPTFSAGQPHQHYPQSYSSVWLPMQPPSTPHSGEESSNPEQSTSLDIQNLHQGLMKSLFKSPTPALPPPPRDGQP